jgi:hypothetical protein
MMADPWTQKQIDYWFPHTMKLLKDARPRARTILGGTAVTDAQLLRAAKARITLAGINERAVARERARIEALTPAEAEPAESIAAVEVDSITTHEDEGATTT